MKEFTINRKSWHYRFIQEIDPVSDYLISDTCSYMKAFVRSFLKAAFSIIVICILGIYVLAPYFAGLLYFIVPSYVTYLSDSAQSLIILSVISQIIIAILFGGSVLWQKTKHSFRKWRYAQHEKTILEDKEEPAKLYKIWKTFRDKACARIEFK